MPFPHVLCKFWKHECVRSGIGLSLLFNPEVLRVLTLFMLPDTGQCLLIRGGWKLPAREEIMQLQKSRYNTETAEK